MKNSLILFITLLLYKTSLSQDLVFNGGFENYNSCYTADPENFVDTSDVIFPGVDAWFKPTYGSSDYFNTCNSTLGLVTYNPFHSGQGMMAIMLNYLTSLKEYLQTKLVSPMQAGQCYHVELYVSSNNSFCANTDNIGIHFGATRVKNFSSVSLPPNDSYTLLPVTPQITYPLGSPIDTTWHKMSGIYTATGGEKYMTIGSFDSTSNMNFYHFYTPCDDFVLAYFDDVSVMTIEDYVAKNIKDTLICAGSSLTYSLDTGYVSILWSSGSTSSTASYSTAGTHWVQVDYGCGVISQSFHIGFLSTTLFDTTTIQICESQFPYTLHAPTGFTTYLWSDGHYGSSTTISTPGTYICTASNTCMSISDTITITTIPGPAPIELGSDTTLCTPFALTLSRPLGYTSYTWSTGATSSSIVVSAAGTYHIAATSICGITSDSIHIYDYERVTLELGTDLELCATQLPYTIHAPDGFLSYVWNTGSTIHNTDITEAGYYSLACTDFCGTQTDSLQVTLLLGSSAIDLGTDLDICVDDSTNQVTILKPLITTSAQQYLWNTSDTTRYLITDLPGTYILQATDACGSSSDTIVLHGCIPRDHDYIYIPSAFTPNDDGINDYLQVYGRGLQVKLFAIYDRWGEKVYETKNQIPIWDGTFHQKPLSTGVYNYICIIETDILQKQKTFKGNITLLK